MCIRDSLAGIPDNRLSLNYNVFVRSCLQGKEISVAPINLPCRHHRRSGWTTSYHPDLLVGSRRSRQRGAGLRGAQMPQIVQRVGQLACRRGPAVLPLLSRQMSVDFFPHSYRRWPSTASCLHRNSIQGIGLASTVACSPTCSRLLFPPQVGRIGMSLASEECRAPTASVSHCMQKQASRQEGKKAWEPLQVSPCKFTTELSHTRRLAMVSSSPYPLTGAYSLPNRAWLSSTIPAGSAPNFFPGES